MKPCLLTNALRESANQTFHRRNLIGIFVVRMKISGHFTSLLLSSDTSAWCRSGNNIQSRWRPRCRRGETPTNQPWIAGVQCVGAKGLSQRPTTSLRKIHGWMALTRALRVRGGINLCLLLVINYDKEGAAITGFKGWFFLVSFYEHSRLEARWSKCEFTLCIGNTHVLKLLF